MRTRKFEWYICQLRLCAWACVCVCRFEPKVTKSISSNRRLVSIIGLIADQHSRTYAINVSTQTGMLARGIQPFNKITIKIVSHLIGFNNYTASRSGGASLSCSARLGPDGPVCRHFWPKLLRHRAPRPQRQHRVGMTIASHLLSRYWRMVDKLKQNTDSNNNKSEHHKNYENCKISGTKWYGQSHGKMELNMFQPKIINWQCGRNNTQNKMPRKY